MRVLHVIPSLGPLRGGPSFALPEMARGLSRRGIEVTVATTDDNGVDAHLDVPLGRPVSLDGLTAWYFRRQTRFYSVSLPLTQWLLQHVREFDLLHIHAVFSYAGLPASIAGARAGIPYIVRPLGTLTHWSVQHRRPVLKRLSLRCVDKPMLDRAAAIHYTSEQERREAEALGIRAPAAVVPLGFQLDDFSGAASPEVFLAAYPALRARPIVLFLSRLDEKKGLDLLIPAFARVRRSVPNAALVLAGSGSQAFVASLRSRAREEGLTDVVFPGFLEGPMKLSALSAATAFVLPSYSENFGIAAIEAMAAGVPAVLSEAVAVAGDAGREGAAMVTRCDADELGNALVTLLRNDALRRRIGERARVVARQQHSSASSARRLHELYASILRELHPAVHVSN